jgi:hypothetical protein
MSNSPLHYDADDLETAIFLSELPKSQIDALAQVISITAQDAKDAIKLLQECE